MKIVDIKTWIVGTPSGRTNWIFLKLVTDEGIEGTGECTNWSYRDFTIERCIRELGKAFVIGQDPFRIEQMWQRIYTGIHDFRKPGMIQTPVMSAFEMACWDIIGKKLNEPVYNLLGGMYHEKLRAYTSLGEPAQIARISLDTPENYGKAAAQA
ncbi:MAG: hypothetical protein QXI32_05920, partial [Candidatus Bathyarchaeia archaeon]